MGDKAARVVRILVIDQVAAQVTRAATRAQVAVIEARTDAAVALNVQIDGGFLAGRNGPVIEQVGLGPFFLGPAETGKEKAGLAITFDRKHDIREIENRHILDVKDNIFCCAVFVDGHVEITGPELPGGGLGVAGGIAALTGRVIIFSGALDTFTGEMHVILFQENVPPGQLSASAVQIETDRFTLDGVAALDNDHMAGGLEDSVRTVVRGVVGGEDCPLPQQHDIAAGRNNVIGLVVVHRVGFDTNAAVGLFGCISPGQGS